MKALRFRRFGPPSVLAFEEVPRPEPLDDEALVQVKAAAINPSDVKNVAGQFPATTLPRTPGRDFSGIVVTGTRYQGQEVWSSGPGLGITRDGAQSAGPCLNRRCVLCESVGDKSQSQAQATDASVSI